MIKNFVGYQLGGGREKFRGGRNFVVFKRDELRSRAPVLLSSASEVGHFG